MRIIIEATDRSDHSRQTDDMNRNTAVPINSVDAAEQHEAGYGAVSFDDQHHQTESSPAHDGVGSVSFHGEAPGTIDAPGMNAGDDPHGFGGIGDGEHAPMSELSPDGDPNDGYGAVSFDG